MPILYLSPSTQENNNYITGGTEEEWMNRLADALVPYLTASGIQYVRNTPEMTAASSIRASDEGSFDLHLALHSNASPPESAGQQRGINVYHYPGSTKGTDAAELIADQLKKIYPLPDQIFVQPNTEIGEVRLPKATSVFIELGYHDNPDDATWITNHLDAAARAIAQGLTKYFELPFLTPRPPRQAVVDVNWGYLNIRALPKLTAPVIARAYDGTKLTVINEWQDWYLVKVDNELGWASSNFVTLI